MKLLRVGAPGLAILLLLERLAVVPSHTRVTEMVTCSLLEIRLFGLFRENYSTRQVWICKAFILL